MTTGDVADGIGHRQDRQSEGQGYAQQANAEGGERRGKHRAAATAEDQPEGAEELGGTALY